VALASSPECHCDECGRDDSAITLRVGKRILCSQCWRKVMGRGEDAPMPDKPVLARKSVPSKKSQQEL
jgi:hypothetical protein